MSELVSPKLEDLSNQFDKLEKDTHEKGKRLFDAKRADLYDQSCNDIDSFTKAVEAQIETEHVEKLAKLTNVNIMLQCNNLWKRKCLQKNTTN